MAEEKKNGGVSIHLEKILKKMCGSSKKQYSVTPIFCRNKGNRSDNFYYLTLSYLELFVTFPFNIVYYIYILHEIFMHQINVHTIVPRSFYVVLLYLP